MTTQRIIWLIQDYLISQGVINVFDFRYTDRGVEIFDMAQQTVVGSFTEQGIPFRTMDQLVKACKWYRKYREHFKNYLNYL